MVISDIDPRRAIRDCLLDGVKQVIHRQFVVVQIRRKRLAGIRKRGRSHLAIGNIDIDRTDGVTPAETTTLQCEGIIRR
ncbi:MAG: hypothetical protein HZT40_14460 [Candidatus Thiothrix singaporensis]|uniref:Uncharacterized protein n=1 Tax=Candidatus Thiothrix singaporensis TaxID=2799669 RepID=A0A7L6ATY3_9GAMM|nr:MAG: hypothetical protein HZT40_14460 [Candidatus Thiothrix singaporensis]